MRIGIVTSSYPLSAADTVNAGVFVRDIAHLMAEAGHQVHVVTPRKYGPTEPSPQVPVAFIPWAGGAKDLASASLRNPLTLFQYATLVVNGLWYVPHYVRTHRLEMLLAMWAIPNGLFCLPTGLPFGVWALGSDIWARRKYPLGEAIVRRVLRRAHFRFADGMALAREVEQLAGLPCRFVPSVRQLLASPVETIALPIGPNFLFIGRYEVNKGPDVLVEAMRRFLDEGGQAHLHMFGGGSLESRLRERIVGYEAHIHLNGFAPPHVTAAYMQVCDRLIIPSRIESIPLVFGDAMQMRLPVVSTAVGDLNDLVTRLQVGSVVPANNPDALAAALRAAAKQPRSNFDSVWAGALAMFDLHVSVRMCLKELQSASVYP